jgi:UDP-glucose 4-epimerase
VAHFAAGNLMSAACLLTHRQGAGDPAIWEAGSDLIPRQLGWRPRFDSIYSIVETAWTGPRQNPRGCTYQTLPHA